MVSVINDIRLLNTIHVVLHFLFYPRRKHLVMLFFFHTFVTGSAKKIGVTGESSVTSSRPREFMAETETLEQISSFLSRPTRCLRISSLFLLMELVKKRRKKKNYFRDCQCVTGNRIERVHGRTRIIQPNSFLQGRPKPMPTPPPNVRWRPAGGNPIFACLGPMNPSPALKKKKTFKFHSKKGPAECVGMLFIPWAQVRCKWISIQTDVPIEKCWRLMDAHKSSIIKRRSFVEQMSPSYSKLYGKWNEGKDYVRMINYRNSFAYH